MKARLSFIVLVALLVVLPAAAAENLSDTAVQPGGQAVASEAQTLFPDRAENFYTDRGVFQAANPGLPLEDFETAYAPPGSGVILACPQPASSTGSTGCYDPGELLAGFSMTSPGASTPGEELVIVEGAAGFGSPPGVILGSNTFVAQTRLDFSPAVKAVGFDIVTLVAGNSVDIQVYDEAGALLNGQNGVTAGVAGSFWGVDTDLLIGAILITDPSTADVELLDNMEFGVPVPVELQRFTVE